MRFQVAVAAFGFLARGLCLPTIHDGGESDGQLRPVASGDGKQDKLDLKNRVTLKWGNEDATATLQADFGGDEKVLDMENFVGDLTSVQHDDGVLSFTFKDRASFDSAAQNWGWVNDKESHQIILIVNYVEIDQSYRSPYRVTSMTHDLRRLAIALHASEAGFKEVIRTGHLRIETMGSKLQAPAALTLEREPEDGASQNELRRRMAKSTHWGRGFSNVTRRWENSTALYKRAPFLNSTRRSETTMGNVARRSPTYPNATRRWESPYANVTRRWTNTTRRWENTTSLPTTLYRRQLPADTAPYGSSMSLANHFTGPIFEEPTASLKCTSCSTSGSISVALDVSISSSSISKAFLEFTTEDLSLDLNLALEGNLKEKFEDSKPLWKVQGKKIDIPGLATFLVSAEFGIGWAMELGGDGKVSLGIEHKVSGKARVCLLGCDGHVGFHSSTTPHDPHAAGSLTSSLSLHPTLSLSATTSLFDAKSSSSSSNTTLLLTAPALSGTLSTQSSVHGGVCGQAGYKFGLLSDLRVGTSVRVERNGKKVGSVWQSERDALYGEEGRCFGIRRRELDG